MKMDPPPILLCVLLLVVSAHAGASSSKKTDCSHLLQTYLQQQQQQTHQTAAPFTSDNNLLFFLHLPRTAGTTFFSCMLQKGTPPSRRCPQGYDALHIDPARPHCQLLTSHDDLSILQQLPSGTAVVTQLRDPVERVLSAYEFTVTVAAAAVVQAQQQAASNSTLGLRESVWRPTRTPIKDTWPWSHLTPWFASDMMPKLQAMQPMAPTAAADPTMATPVPSSSQAQVDPYNNELFMPLQDFIRHPMAAELLHNGELLQVLGLTNYSHWAGAAELRACMLQDAGIAEQLFEFGLQRLETFAHVGITSRVHESAEVAAAVLNMPLDGPAYAGGQAQGADLRDKMLLDHRAQKEAEVAGMQQQLTKMLQVPGLNSTDEGQRKLARLQGRLYMATMKLLDMHDPAPAPADDPTDLPLGEAFLECADKARSAGKGSSSPLSLFTLPGRGSVTFDKASRQRIPSHILAEIGNLNALDMRLYQRAEELFESRRQELLASGVLQRLPAMPSSATAGLEPKIDVL